MAEKAIRMEEKYQRVLGLLKGEAPFQHHETFAE
jgi:hypothetical protein